MEKSLGFLWTKQAAILDNIANAETPNYKAKVVTFEETVQAKLEAARSGVKPRQSVRQVLNESEFAVTEHLDSTRMDENGVNVTAQSVEAMRNAYQMRYVLNITRHQQRPQAAARGGAGVISGTFQERSVK